MRLPHSLAVVVASALLVLSACDVPTEELRRTSAADAATATLSFGMPVDDSTVSAFLVRHRLRPVALLLHADGFSGTHGVLPGEDAAAAVASARDAARELSHTGLQATLARVDETARVEGFLEVAPGGVLEPALQRHQRALSSIVAGAPLVWGVVASGESQDLRRAEQDPIITRSASAQRINGRLVLASLPSPADPEEFGAPRGQVSASPAVAPDLLSQLMANQPQRWYPDEGRLYYNGKYSLSSSFVFNKPGGWVSDDRVFEQDFAFDPGYFEKYGDRGFITCTTWTDLPRRYDDCFTLGVDEGELWAAGFGTVRTDLITPGKLYTATWTFRTVSKQPVLAGTPFLVYSQEVSRWFCPVFEPACYQALATQRLLSGNLQRGVAATFTWNYKTPFIRSVAPDPIEATGTVHNIEVRGEHFRPGVRLRFRVGENQYDVPDSKVQWVNPGLLRVEMAPGSEAATWSVQATNPCPPRNFCHQLSNRYTFEVSSPDRPAPVISQVAPAIVPAIAGEQTVSLRGNRFETNAYVIFRTGSDTYRVAAPLARVVSPYQLDVKVQLGTTPADWSAQVVNPGGVPSNRHAFRVSNEQPPEIGGVQPNPVPASGEPQTLVIGGNRFAAGATLVFRAGGSTHRVGAPDVAVVSGSRIEARVNLGTEPAQWSVQVVNPGGLTSGTFTFPVGGATPSIARVSPDPVPASGAEQVLTLHGAGFMSRASLVMRVNGNTYTLGSTHVTVVNPTQIQARVSLGTTPATWTAQVVNPGGLRSAQYAFNVVTEAPPVLARVSPNPFPASAAEQTLTLTGSGFREGASLVMRVNGTSYRVGAPHVTVAGSTQINARVTLGTTPATWSAQVVNPDGLMSAQFSFPVVGEPAPALAAMTPDPVPAIAAEQVVRFAGSGFVTGATMVMRVNGTGYRIGPPEVTVVNPSLIEARVNLGATPAPWSAQVVNPTGIVSGMLPFQVVRAPAPSASSVTPDPAPATGGEQTISIHGGGFLPGAELVFRVSGNTYRLGTPHVTVVSPSRIDARVSLGTVPADWSVQAVNADGQASGTVGFRVGARAPSVSGVSPAPVPAIPLEQTIDIHGSGFASGAELVFRVGGNTYRIGSPEVTVHGPSLIRARVSLGTTPAAWTVQAVNPDGQASGQMAFTVAEPVPAIASVSPSPVPASGARQTISFYGSGFNPGAVVVFRVSGNEYRIGAPDVTVVSATRIDARVNLGTVPATWSAQVVNPYGTSSSVFGFPVQ